ncbi:uncharacterized protein F5891DRAFT_1128900 [Suillus fuscotomentosus]|uniref:F-box protein n=1 Tax=Suillus fuscotomentosus TaxID=1912939 RepID=A0AAD4E797_9AGAM|nr:uncharacterized protein F5891DRAFT_1128900 [Suillus fuscotomentosus]KAG1899749.1 hypothetical protein F5891DRAFT_1128900 [Suillus fuscotomentosus]
MSESLAGHQPQFADECVIVEVFCRAPVYDNIFSYISPRELVRLGHSCHAAYAASKDYSRRAFNINRHLSGFISQPLLFRSLQARTGTLIAGSNALQFLDRTVYDEADMDMYVHPGHAREVMDYIVEKEGYEFKPHSRQPQDYRKIVSDKWDNTRIRQDYQIKGVKSVLSLEKHGSDGGHQKIQVIECTMSPFDTIINFHSTCVMNFIAFDAAYSLYPIATFEDRSTLQVWRARPLHDVSVAIKYGQRGFQWLSALPLGDTSLSASFYPHVTRTVGDRYTWKMSLDIQGIDLRPQMSSSSTLFQFDPVICNSWSLLERDEEMATVYEPIQSAIFRYNYTTTNALLHLDLCWVQFLPIVHYNIPYLTVSHVHWYTSKVDETRKYKQTCAVQMRHPYRNISFVID